MYLATLLYPIKIRIRTCLTYNFGMYNADKLAHEDAGRLVAALEAVEEQHPYIEVFEFDDMNGVWKVDEDGDQISAGVFCRTCSDSNVIDEIEDCEYDISGDYGLVSWPCPTITAATTVLRGDKKSDG